MMLLSMQAGILNEGSVGSVSESAGSFTLGAHRGTVGSAKASASTSVAAEVHSEASGSNVSSRTSPGTSSPLQGAATGQILLPAIWLQAIVSNLCNTSGCVQ